MAQGIKVAVISIEQSAPPINSKADQFMPEVGPYGFHMPSWADPISLLDMPVIAVTDGYVLGQAMELALACDLRFSSPESFFGLPHINRGLIPWDGGTQRLTRLVGKSKAMLLILTGNYIDANEALRIGLVNQIIENRQHLSSVTELANKMADKSSVALKYTKEVVNRGVDMTLGQALGLEADLYFLLHTSKDRTEGIRAFREKRKARFVGE
jgi:enoyl-CoA hydratase